MKHFIKFVLIAFISITLLLFIFLENNQASYATGYASPNCKEFGEELNSVSDNEVTKITNRSWMDYDQTDYCLQYYLNKTRKENSKYMYEKLYNSTVKWDLTNYQYYYGEIYQALYEQDKYDLHFLVDSFSNIATTNNLTTKQLAETVVAFVQDIPYSYVLDEELCALRSNKNIPCSDGHKNGILTPLDFLYTLVGDCDTRAVLLYLLLQELKIDVAIVVSQKYQHAMISVNLPYSGDFIMYNKKKYYFWETTATGWKPGILPPECNNKSYWKVAI